MNDIIITKHALKQSKKRLSWNEETLKRMIPKIINEGLKHSDVKGQLKKFMDKTYLNHKNANNMRIYGEDLFIFSNNTLITLYRIPTNLINKFRQ